MANIIDSMNAKIGAINAEREIVSNVVMLINIHSLIRICRLNLISARRAIVPMKILIRIKSTVPSPDTSGITSPIGSSWLATRY